MQQTLQKLEGELSTIKADPYLFYSFRALQDAEEKRGEKYWIKF